MESRRDPSRLRTFPTGLDTRPLLPIKSVEARPFSTTYLPLTGRETTGSDGMQATKQKEPLQERRFRELPEKDSNLH